MQFENDSQQSPCLDSPGRGGMIEHNMNNSEKIAELRHSLARYGLPPDRPPISLGHPQADSVLGGGLRPSGLHEVFAEVWSASGFAVLLAMLAARGKPLFWVRPDFEALEYGAVSPQGLAELGGDRRRQDQAGGKTRQDHQRGKARYPGDNPDAGGAASRSVKEDRLVGHWPNLNAPGSGATGASSRHSWII